jgi:hypothetical protein
MSVVFERLIVQLIEKAPGFPSLLNIINDTPEGNFFLAGGAARDTFIENKPVKDIDLFITDLAYENIKDFLAANGNLQTNQFGTFRWFPSADPKLYYDIIRLSRFYNGLWLCENITDTLNQFDITANAVAFDLKSGTFHDPQNGHAHILRKELRAVRFDAPDLPVSKDIPISRTSVLWIRYQYYAKKLGFTIEPITQQWIDDNAWRRTHLDCFKKHFFDPGI